ncbi:ku70-like protein [Laetiporus sulphureus 93-53]|uniref:ATP-dependent DNA helicase II subunit 1 n=1 Tax=Laetiporus sulphureus 93-53 TaxID=1314785 RepID=A0A165E1J4_9APHY|nr:ku70-like protein [Laetiporus sulphureus 93-53]KZT06069.1 ku70-like protein [Laetiporus sulphureus 93-53]
MGAYDEWNRVDEDEEDELEDYSYLEAKRDVILFCIDCSSSMLELYDDPKYENVQTCHLLTALEAAMQIQKKKVVVGPDDAVGIMLFNTTRRNETSGEGSEIKQGTYVYQPISTINAPGVQELIRLLDAAREDPSYLRETFQPMTGSRVAMGDVFTSCNWVFRDRAPRSATKRVFLITDEDNPHSGPARDRLVIAARTTLIDLVQAGITVEPFFIATEEKGFDKSKFYSSVLLPSNIVDDDENNAAVLPESISITRIEDLLAQMRFHEVPKRAQFTVPFELAQEFVIGVKGYSLVTEQKKGSYRYFIDLEDRMEVVASRTVYVDEGEQAEVDKTKVLYGMELGAVAAIEEAQEESDREGMLGTRVIAANSRVFYTADELRSFRTMGLDPSKIAHPPTVSAVRLCCLMPIAAIRLLGFKDQSELAFEDNVKHSLFIYPDEMNYSGSKRTFSALLKTMLRKKKIALVLAVTRRNAIPTFYAMLPQAEKVEEGGWHEPPGFHLIPLPFADDIRPAPITEGARASDELKDAARKWIDKLGVKNGTYPPDAYPNPALAYHNAQLEASAFREEFDPAAFEDLTVPKYDMLHKRAGTLMSAWKHALPSDGIAAPVPSPTGSKRKADISVDEAEVRSKHEVGTLDKLRVDQLREFLKSKSQPMSGRKAELVERVSDWLNENA